MVAYTILSALLLAGLSQAACTRELLKGASDAFFKSAFSRSATTSGITLAPGAKITQNNQVLPNLAATAYGNMTSFLKPFGVHVVDTETCNIVSLALAKEGDAPAILSLRLKLEGGNVQEVEILNALSGSHALFNTTAFPSPEPAIWNAPQGGSLSHAELVKVGNSYAEGLQTGADSVVQASPDCPRFENGVKTTDHCGQNTTLFVWPVTDRRWYADTETGNVAGSFWFSYKDGKGLMNKAGIRPSNSTTGLWLHEYFKVQNGKIVNVIAAMQTLAADYKDVWRV